MTNYITVKEEVNAYDLGDRLWSGGLTTWKTIQEHNKEEEAVAYLNEIFGCDEESPDITSINDVLWFDSEQVLEALGISDEDVKEKELCFNEEDIDTLAEEHASDLVEYLRKELEEKKPIALIYTDVYRIESAIERDLTDSEIDALVELGA